MILIFSTLLHVKEHYLWITCRNERHEKVYHERKNPCIIARRDTRGIKISLDRDYTGKGRVQITIIPAFPLKFDLKPPRHFHSYRYLRSNFTRGVKLQFRYSTARNFTPRKDINLPSDCTHFLHFLSTRIFHRIFHPLRDFRGIEPNPRKMRAFHFERVQSKNTGCRDRPNKCRLSLTIGEGR